MALKPETVTELRDALLAFAKTMSGSTAQVLLVLDRHKAELLSQKSVQEKREFEDALLGIGREIEDQYPNLAGFAMSLVSSFVLTTSSGQRGKA